MENFAGLQAHRKRGRSACTSLTPHHTLNEEWSARFTAQHLSALLRKLGYLFFRVYRTSTRPPVRNTPENQREMFHMLASVGTCNMILLIHVVVSWHLSKQGIRWPVLHDRLTLPADVSTHRGYVFFEVYRWQVSNSQLIAGPTLIGFLYWTFFH